MANRIEETIIAMQEFIKGSKNAAFSSTKIIVDSQELLQYLSDLEKYIPEDVHKYQRMLGNRDKILQDAKKKAQEIEDKASAYADHLVSENQITKAAEGRAEEIINEAQKEAERIIENANDESYTIRTGAFKYTTEMLTNIRSILNNGIEDMQSKYTQLITALSEHQNIVNTNLKELSREEDDNEEEVSSPFVTLDEETDIESEDEDDSNPYENSVY